MSIVIDRPSLLVDVPGAITLAAVEQTLEPAGLTIGFAAPDEPVSDWLARGAPGAPSTFEDPADHLVAGFSATLRSGRRIDIRPAPRRAVGPDLFALVFGAGGRFASIDRVWLRIHERREPRVSLLTSGIDLDPPLESGEISLLEAIARELDR